MKDITHIERPALPWRSERVTECNLDASRHATWTRDEASAKERELGKQRFSLFVCQTCYSTAARHSDWDQNPASCLNRYTERYQWRYWSETRADPEKKQFEAELRAIAALIAEHRTDFDSLVLAYSNVVDLTEERRARAR